MKTYCPVSSIPISSAANIMSRTEALLAHITDILNIELVKGRPDIYFLHCRPLNQSSPLQIYQKEHQTFIWPFYEQYGFGPKIYEYNHSKGADPEKGQNYIRGGV